jgi:hypothetical protein
LGKSTKSELAAFVSTTFVLVFPMSLETIRVCHSPTTWIIAEMLAVHCPAGTVTFEAFFVGG